MRHTLPQLATVVLLPIAIAACQNTGSQQANAPADTMGGAMAAAVPANPAAIDSLREAYTRAAEAGDVDAMVGFFTDDAVLLGADGKVYNGANELRSYMSDTTMVASNIQVHNENGPNFSGDVAWESGTFSQSLTPKKGGKAMTVKGNYLVVLRRQSDGSWKIVAEADIPSEMPPAMPTR